ncbi:MAG TPA: FkbM family methyltransferase [Dongiaceae bacterium]|nr:FkbM family methyltransferase [Dongiaceae bacterium]
MPEQLIYDVGANDGADTAYYLSLGHRVVAIEANPVLAEQLRRRFADEIAAGRLTLLNIGVAETEGEMDFWVSENPVWSSFHREIAARQGASHYKIRVPTRLFADVIARHGVPHYCKVDIEGNDGLCLEGLSPDTAPAYLSIEMSHDRGGSDLARMRALGYARFKIVSQVTRTQPTRELTQFFYTLPSPLLRQAQETVRAGSGVVAIGDWHFADHSSGAFGEDTPGDWQSYDATLEMWTFLRDLDRAHNAQGLLEWYDIHGAKPGPA